MHEGAINFIFLYGNLVPIDELQRRRKPCSVCGLIKRHAMNRLAYEGGYSVLATGHNLDDEAAALYLNAARLGKNALTICTISDNPFTGEELDAEARQNTFTQMMEIALEIA